MEYHWALFTLVTLLSVQPGCSSRPIISPEPPQLVVPLDGPLSLHCHGNGSVRWQREDRGQGRRVRGENRQGRVSIIHLPRAQPPHMGRYTCVEEDSGDKSSIYVFVKDPDHAFRKSIVFDIVAGAGDSVSIPCLATDPGVTDLRLEMCDGQPLPNSLRYSSSTETGVTVGTVQKAFEGCYICTGMLGGATVTSGRYQLNVRLAPDTVAEVLVRERGPVLLTQGERLSLSCSTSNVNSDIQLRWFTPPGVQASLEKTSQILTEPISHVRTATLHVTAVTAEASGLYRCEAQNERGTSSSSISVNVYERGFINVTGWQNETVRVRAGESLRLLIEMEAYPRPHTLSWAHAGHQLANTSDHVITTHTLGHSYSSELHLVRLKVAESGIYAFLASNGDATISRTFTVHVISKPEIVSHEGPVDGQVRCVAEGYPTPQITWYYCDQPHVRCSSLLNATQEEEDVVTVTLTKPAFGKREVESRLNISKTHTTLECVATVEGEQVYTLFSISDRSVPHQLFTPLLISFIAAAILLCLILLVLSYKYMQKPKFQIQWKVIEGIHGNNYVYIDPTQLPYNQQWEFPRDKLRFGKTLGSGAFGKVVEATAYGLADTVMTVAVKMLKPSAHATEKEALMSELKVLSYLGNHINIVNLLGACTIGGPTLVITEYCCYGDLLNFLRRKRDTFCYSGQGDECYYRNVTLPPDAAGDNQNGYMTMRPTAGLLTTEKRVSLHKGGCSGEGVVVAEVVQEDDLTLDTEDLLSFSYQVAKGMDFLTSKNCIHRDLAARNILITEGRVAKICDFGLARDITTDSNYVVKGNARLPVKWMSPESIFECVYTFESDVWSYGILLWEIFSLGSSPYPGMPVDAQFYKMIKEGYRMNSPEFAPSQMYEMMRTCWDKDPFKRPAFGKVVERIEQQLSDRTKHIYLNFSSRVPMGTGAPEDQNSQLRCLYSVGGGPAPTQPLLANDNVFLEGTEPRHQRV